MTQNHDSFPFERLDVFKVLRQYAAVIHPLCNALPRGESEAKSQLKRASLSIMNNLCEGSGRWSPGEKGQFYFIARGSAFECAGALVWLQASGVGAADAIDSALQLLRRICAMLTSMVQRYRQRPEGPATSGGDTQFGSAASF